ncbi:amine sulfotransferase-like [Uloborus diversus]|uniref:amine sulfotransferase-like n=1 Tax=Uloborus diversus TaxID=327109 RepID=UPI00240A1209|nr:amine sulfotransferase-like [Uloborus diversus]
MCENIKGETKTDEQPKEYPLMYVRGFAFPGLFQPDDIEKVLDFKPRDTDIFVVTYPKCGTTWSQFIVWEILNKGAIPPSPNAMMFKHFPFLEVTGVDDLENHPPPRPLKTHLPYNLQPYNSSAKYIYITRNPYDCCVSYFYHLQMDNWNPKLSFSEHVEAFTSGKIPFGDFFDHVLSWYKHRNEPNILFLTYEGMKRNKKETILKIAKFLGENYYKDLQDEKVMENCLKYSDFQYMKELGMFFPDLPEKDRSLELDREKMKAMLKGLALPDKRIGNTENFKEQNFFRKGEIGDWKNHFSREDIKKFNEYVIRKLKNTDMENYWLLADEETSF